MSRRPSVHLLLGPEEGEKEGFVHALKKEIASASGEPEVHRYYPFETRMGDILAVLRNGSLFSSHRLVLLSCLEQVTLREDQKMLAEYCAAPARDTTLVLLSTEVKVPAAIEKAVPAEGKKIFWELFEKQKNAWIVAFFRKKDITLEPEAVALLLELVENNTRELEATCGQLAQYFGPGARIGAAELERILYHSKEENVFSLFDRVACRDLAASLEVLQRILFSREADSVQLMAGLLFQFRRLRSFKVLVENRYPPGEAFARVGIRSKRLQKTLQDGHESYSLRELERIIVLIADFDLSLRSARAELQNFLLKMFLYYVTVRGGRRPPRRARDRE